MKFHKSMRIHQKELENSEKFYMCVCVCVCKGPKLYIGP